MSLIRSLLQTSGNRLQHCIGHRINPVRACTTGSSNNTASFENTRENVSSDVTIAQAKVLEIKKGEPYKFINLDICIAYMDSNGYKRTYGDLPVWTLYRRNHKGQLPPEKTRRTCIRDGKYATSNPCPICRDEYLKFHFTNVKLLEQFISPHNGEILSYSKTGICQARHKDLLVSVYRAQNLGYLTFDVPIRKYDYSVWYTPESEIIIEPEEQKHSANTYTQ